MITRRTKTLLQLIFFALLLACSCRGARSPEPGPSPLDTVEEAAAYQTCSWSALGELQPAQRSVLVGDTITLKSYGSVAEFDSYFQQNPFNLNFERFVNTDLRSGRQYRDEKQASGEAVAESKLGDGIRTGIMKFARGTGCDG